MNRIKFVLGLLCTYAAYYTVLILCDRRCQRCASEKINEQNVTLAPQPRIAAEGKKTTNSILVHDTVLRSLFAYDNSDHKNVVHVRFDAQMVDLLAKFKMATGVDMTKFVAFAVKYLFETNPELKTIIKQYLQNTEL
ncbi:hypothetical protein [Mucilaginibacter psychrotolerans]|uniref:Uncharacterized protein n=1 Tax=Mucilaginibacter psychrotolerans TaxID=1524096 RepID=A0A4Y8SDM8_9SPHI|nr:hypothetical protein [Mucilaginibacter psychrotolerans]TFF37038.1 hypothetical protein E2R66_13200 [Mucilaginibacter psychrotolerans]